MPKLFMRIQWRLVLGLGLVFALAAPGLSAQTLRTAAQDSSPKFVMQRDGSVAGISVDVMRAIERVDASIRFTGEQTFVPFKRIEIMLERGDLDVFLGFVKNDERARKFVYVEPPIYRVADVLLVREDDPIDVQRLEDIVPMTNAIVLVSAGTAQASQLKRMSINVDDGGKSVATNLQKLMLNRGRLLMQSEVEVVNSVREQGMEELVRILPARFNESGRYLAFAKHVPESTITKVQTALEKLSKSGELANIYSRYR